MIWIVSGGSSAWIHLQWHRTECMYTCWSSDASKHLSCIKCHVPGLSVSAHVCGNHGNQSDGMRTSSKSVWRSLCGSGAVFVLSIRPCIVCTCTERGTSLRNTRHGSFCSFVIPLIRFAFQPSHTVDRRYIFPRVLQKELVLDFYCFYQRGQAQPHTSFCHDVGLWEHQVLENVPQVLAFREPCVCRWFFKSDHCRHSTRKWHPGSHKSKHNPQPGQRSPNWRDLYRFVSNFQSMASQFGMQSDSTTVQTTSYSVGRSSREYEIENPVGAV